MQITSPSFIHGGLIPAKYTCDGDNVSPPFVINGVPERAQSLVLLMDDPDVPQSIRPDGMWDHWVVFDMKPDTRTIGEGETPPGTVGKNTGGQNAYGGPCPPDREHRYFFRLFALDTLLGLGPDATKREVLSRIGGHVLAEATLMGRYDRPR